MADPVLGHPFDPDLIIWQGNLDLSSYQKSRTDFLMRHLAWDRVSAYYGLSHHSEKVMRYIIRTEYLITYSVLSHLRTLSL